MAYQVSYRVYNSDTAYITVLSNRASEMLVHYLSLSSELESTMETRELDGLLA